MITKEELQKIAKLSHLTIDEKHQSIFTKQINTILDYIDQINQLPDILEEELMKEESVLCPEDLMVLREDKIVPCDEGSSFLKSSPHVEDRYFLVPKVINPS